MAIAETDAPAIGVGHCWPGREVVLRFRSRRTGKSWTASIICPAMWTKGRMLEYARRCHPNETVVIEEWKTRSQDDKDAWKTRFWVVNPNEMPRYRQEAKWRRSTRHGD